MGGGKGGSTGTSTQYSGVQIPQEVLARYNKATDRAEDVSKQTWQNYGGEFVAPVNATQQAGYGTMMGGQNYTNAGWQGGMQMLNTGINAAAPLMNQASDSINTGQAQGQALGAAGLGQAAQAYNQAQPYNQQAGQAFNQAYGGAQPYNQMALGAAGMGMQNVDPSQLNLNQFYNPYQQQVTQATMAQLNQQQAQQRNDQRGQMIREGSWGGDRGGIANANMVNQQNLATGSVLSGLNQQNYNQALAAAQQQQGVGLGAAQANRAAYQQGAGQLLGIGQQGYAQGMGYGQAQQGLGAQEYTQGMGQAQYTGNMGQQMYGQGIGAGQAQQGLGTANYGMYSNAGQNINQMAGQAFGQNMQTAQGQIGFGSLQQQTQQAQDSAMYNQWMQERGYPFQTSQFYTNAVMGTGPLSGSQSYGGSFTPQPFFSDERVKENIKEVGRTHKGDPIISFNYKGDPRTQIGLSAQDVEESHPEAVGSLGGIKTVNYKEATKDAERPHKAAGGPLGGDVFGYTPPNTLPPGVGVLGTPPTMPSATPVTGGNIGDIVATQRAMLSANAPGSGPPSNAGSAEALGASQGAANARTAAAGPMAGMGASAPSESPPGAPGEPAGLGAAKPIFLLPSDGGSANGATGAAGAGSSEGGTAGSVGASVGGNTGTDSGQGSGPGELATGGAVEGLGRAGYAKGGDTGEDFWRWLASRNAYSDAPWATKQGSAGTGSIVPQLQAATSKPSAVIKADLPAKPAAAKPTADQATGAVNDLDKTAKSGEALYGLGKDALVGSAAKGTPQIGTPGQGTPAVGKPNEPGYRPASADYRPASVDYRPASSDYKPVTGGLAGYGGKWGAERPADTTATTATPAASPNATAPPTAPATTVSGTLPAAPAPVVAKAPDAVTSDATGLGSSSTDTSVADTGSLFENSPYLDSAAYADAGVDAGAGLGEAATDVADYAPAFEDATMFAARGGRAGYATSGKVGLDKDKGVMPFGGTSVLPEGVYDAEDPSKVLEADKTKTDPTDPGGGGVGAADVVGAAAPIAGAAIGSIVPGLGTLAGGLIGSAVSAGTKLVTKRRAEGGEVNDNEPPEPGLAGASSAMENNDNVHWGVFSRSQGHKMVGRATTKNRARTIRDKRDNDYGGYDHFVKPISPSRTKRYAGGRLGFADAGEATLADDEAERELVAERLRARETETPAPAFMERPTPAPTALAAATTEPPALNPLAQQIEEGRRAQQQAGQAGANRPGVMVADISGQGDPGGGTGDSSTAGGGAGSAGVGTASTAPPRPTPPPVVTAGGARNNPGNVKGPDGSFLNLPDFNTGVAVMVNNAQDYPRRYNKGQPMTIAQIGAHWAPLDDPNDTKKLNQNWPVNVTREYARMGFDPNKPVDFNDPQQASAFARAVHIAEHGEANARPLDDYLPGYALRNDPAVRKGFGSASTKSTTTPATTPAPADDAVTSSVPSGLGASDTDARSMYGQKQDWWDRNEQWTMPLLQGIFKMLGSQSRTLAGSIGEGGAAGVGSYIQTGQRQQSIDTQRSQAQTQRATAIAEQIKQAQARYAANPKDLAAKAYLQRLYNAWDQSMGGRGKVPDMYKGTGADSEFNDPRFDKLNDMESPKYLWQQYLVDPTDAKRAAAQAALQKIKSQGSAMAKDGATVIEFKDLHQADLAQEAQRKASNLDAEIKQQLSIPAHQTSRDDATARIKRLEEQIDRINKTGTPDQKAMLPDLNSLLNEMNRRFINQPTSARGGRIERAFGGPTWTPPDEDPNMPPPEDAPPPPGLGPVMTDGAPSLPSALPPSAKPGLGSAETETPLSPPDQPAPSSPLQTAQWKPPERVPLVPPGQEMKKIPPPAAPSTMDRGEAMSGPAKLEQYIKENEGNFSAGEAKELGDTLAAMKRAVLVQNMEDSQKTVTEARNQVLGMAQQQRALQDMKNSINSLPDSGLTSLAPYPEARKFFASAANALSQTVLGKDMFNPNEVGAIEEAIKAQVILSGAQSNAIGQHSQGIMRTIAEASPGPGLSKLGYQRVAAGMEQTMQMMQDRATFLEQWRKDPKNNYDMTGANAAFLASTDNLRKYSDAAILSTIDPKHIEEVKAFKERNKERDPKLTDEQLDAAAAPAFEAKYGKGTYKLAVTGRH